MKAGDIINDCSAFNVRVAEIDPDYLQHWQYPKAQFLVGIDFTDHKGGSCSLVHCGVEFGISREEVEKRSLEYYEDWLKSDQAAVWYGGKDTEDYKKAEKKVIKKVEVLKAGLHITDEQGVLLEEFR